MWVILICPNYPPLTNISITLAQPKYMIQLPGSSLPSPCKNTDRLSHETPNIIKISRGVENRENCGKIFWSRALHLPLYILAIQDDFSVTNKISIHRQNSEWDKWVARRAIIFFIIFFILFYFILDADPLRG